MTTRKVGPSQAEIFVPKTNETTPISEAERNVFGLISSGYLPLANTVTKDGRPAWHFESLAKIIGCGVEELSALLRSKGARFTIEPGARH